MQKIELIGEMTEDKQNMHANKASWGKSDKEAPSTSQKVLLALDLSRSGNPRAAFMFTLFTLNHGSKLTCALGHLHL